MKLTRAPALPAVAAFVIVPAVLFFASTRAVAAVDAGLVFDLTGASSRTVDSLCRSIASSPHLSASFFIPWDQLEEMRREGIPGNLSRLFSSGSAELLSGVYYDIDLRLAGDEIIHSQIKRFKMLAESVAGSPVEGFYPGSLSLNAVSLSLLKGIGFNYALSGESLVSEEIESRRLQAFLMPDGLLLYPVSSRISKAASLPPAAGWLEEFTATAGVLCGDIAGSIPGGTVVFAVALSNHSPESVEELFAAMGKMNIRASSIHKLSRKEPAYFKELPSIVEAETVKLGRFQKLFLAEWRKFQSMTAEFPPALAENIYRMGQSKFFSPSCDAAAMAEMLELSEDFYGASGIVELVSGEEKILAVSSGYFRVYFSADNLNPVLIAVPREGLIIAGRPEVAGFEADTSGTTDEYAMKSYFNFRSYDKGWNVKAESKGGYWRFSAQLTDAPLEMKKTFVLTKDRDTFKYYASARNAGQTALACDVALSVLPAGEAGIYMKSASGEFTGSFTRSSKEFGRITELAFPADGKAPALSFVGNYPHFLTVRERSAEVAYRRKELAPSDRLLTETHFAYKDFTAPPEAKELFGYADIFLDGVPSEQFWTQAARFIDPRRDGPEGADITDVYYAAGRDSSYLFVEGEFANGSNLYIARRGEGSKVLSSKLRVPDELAYYVKMPLTQGSPSAYRWEGVWLSTFEKGFSMCLGKAVEIRLPVVLPEGEWSVYLESGGKISDSVDLELK